MARDSRPADVINLRQARKRLARADKEAKADAARAASSIPGRVRAATRRESERADARLEAHRLDTPHLDTPRLDTPHLDGRASPVDADD